MADGELHPVILEKADVYNLETGELVVPMEYEEILEVATTWYTPYCFETAGVLAARNADCVTLIDTVNGTTVEIAVGDNDVSFMGTCLCVCTEDGDVYYGLDGQEIVFPDVIDMETLDYWVMPYGTFFTACDEDYTYDYIISTTGEILLQATDVNEFTTDGHVLTYDRDADTTSVYSLIND